MSKGTFKERVIWFLIFNVGLMITAAGIAIFKSPNHFAMGGASGMAVVLSAVAPKLNVGSAITIINAVLLLVGFMFLGRDFGISAIYASVAMSAYVSLFEWLFPLTAPLTDDTFLELVWAVMLPGVGSALAFNIGASTGGTDILAMILSKHTSLEVGKALLVTDIAVTLSTFFIFDAKTALYSILGLIFKTFLVDIVIDGINSKKFCTIISSKPEEVRDFILSRLKRGATILDAHGAFTDRPEKVIITVLSRRQAVILRGYIRRVDSHAFITMVSSSEIIGKGFKEI